VNLAELHDELERLGNRPVPVLDDARIDALEQRLLDEFVALPAVESVPQLAATRRRRRQVLVAGVSAAAAALAGAIVIAQDEAARYEVSAAIGAVAMYPDGASRTVQAGDHVPSGGLIRTGPEGAVTIEETTVGPDHVILLDEENIALLPAPPAPPAPVVQDAEPPAEPSATAPPTAPAAAPVTLVPTIATPAPPVPAAVNPAPLSVTVTETSEGVEVSWTPSDADSVVKYIVVRGTADSDVLVDVAELPADRTGFIDTTPPAGVELCYRVVAVDAEGLPVAESETHTIVFEGSGSSNEIPPSTDAPPATEPDGTTTTTTVASSTTVPATADPSTTVAETSVPTTVGGFVPDTAPASDTSGGGGGQDGNLDHGG
jgi:hypothetical protein